MSTKCKLCGYNRPLVKAHIIPRSFYEIDPSDKIAPALCSDSQQFHLKRSPMGMYDPNILCEGCERKFSRPDGYVFELLVRDIGTAKTLKGSSGDIVARVFESFEYVPLKEFFLALLLRSELTDNFFFQHVSLGRYRKILIDYFEQKKSNALDDFDVMLFYYDGIDSVPFAPPSVARVSSSRIKMQYFHLGRFGCSIKIDRRPMPSDFKPLLLRPEQPLLVVKKQFFGTEFHAIAEGIFKNKQNKKYFGKSTKLS